MKFNNRNVQVSPRATIGTNVRIGDNTVIYDNVVVEDNSIICNDCVIGEPLYDYYLDEDNYRNPVTRIGAGAMIRSHTIIYAGNEIGANFQTGHRVTIREFAKFGANNMIGTLGDIQGYAELGDFCRMQCNVHIGQATKLHDFVMVFPFTVFTNDPHPPSMVMRGAEVKSFSQVAVHCTMLPDSIVGRGCLVGANSVVNRVYPDETIIVGSPAKAIGPIGKIRSQQEGFEGQPHYPWVHRFARNMPWEAGKFADWARSQVDRYDIPEPWLS